jgi:hypothetical protein
MHDAVFLNARALARAAMILMLAWTGWSAAAEAPRRVLFVGNSLTYINNLPAATASLALGDVAVDAFALPGATLADHQRNPRLAERLANGHYTDVVFQEQGGRAVCGHASCRSEADFQSAERAGTALAELARAHGARVYYLGTWQVNPAVEPALVAGERHIAKAMHARYIEIGGTWNALRHDHPDGAWLRSDGQHPGYTTTALMAIRVWQALSGVHGDRPPCVTGELYDHAPSGDGFFHVDRGAAPVTCLVTQALATALATTPAGADETGIRRCRHTGACRHRGT